MKHLTLFELHQIIQRIFYLNFENNVWIEAEISEKRSHRGHVYMTLIEKDPVGQILAKASSALWKNKAAALQKKYGEIFDRVIKTGNKVKMLCQVEFHPQYGYSLQVQDFDPAYTEGYLFLEKKKTIERLRKEQLFEQNKYRELPLVVSRIAIISSASAAGYQDFIHQLTNNVHGYQFTWELFPSAMQGTKVTEQFPEALRLIEDRKGDFDAIIVVRGGGASIDLSDFDLYEVASAVARSSLPVIAGIGHERDESVTGMVAHTQVKTPTAAAEFLIDHNFQFETEVQQIYRSIRERAMQYVQSTRQNIQHTELSIRHQIQTRISNERYALDKQMSDVSNLATRSIHNEKMRVQEYQMWIVENNPFQIMQRGYAMVFQNQHRIRDLDHLEDNQPIELVMNHQKINVYEKS